MGNFNFEGHELLERNNNACSETNLWREETSMQKVSARMSVEEDTCTRKESALFVLRGALGL